MVHRNLVLGFVVRAMIVYGVLVAPWPGLREGYANGFRFAAGMAFGHFGRDGLVSFHPLSGNDSGMDTQIRLGKRGEPYIGPIKHNTRIADYLPTSCVIALVIATPIPWSRRWKALLWGLVCVHAFIALRMTLNLVRWYCEDRVWSLYDVGPFTHKVLIWTWELVIGTPTASFVAPFFIWLIVTFLRSDWEAFFEPSSDRGKGSHDAKRIRTVSRF